MSNNSISQTVEERASAVSSLVRQSVDTWLQISQHVYDARESLKPDDYEEFVKLAGLTISICDKLIRIAKTPRLYSDGMERHRSRLEGWTTLYEVSKLKPAKIDELVQVMDKSPDLPVTREFIETFKEPSGRVFKKRTLIGSILIDEDDLQRFDFDQFLKLKESLDDIQRIVDRSAPAVSMKLHGKEIGRIEQLLIDADSVLTEDEDSIMSEQTCTFAQETYDSNNAFI